MRVSLRSVLMRSVLAGVCGLPVVLLAAAPATASDAGPQHSATPNVSAEIGYASAQVHPGGQATMTVSLINHGPQSLDDHTSVHVTVTMPQHTEVSPNVLETIRGNAPKGSRNAVPMTRSIPLTRVFVRSAPGFFDVVVPAGSFGNSTSFRTYTFTLHVSPTVTSGSQLVGGGVAVALENYVGLTVAKSVVPPAPMVVTTALAKPSHKPGPRKSPRSLHTAGTSERIGVGTPVAGCSAGPLAGSNAGSSSGASSSPGPTAGSGSSSATPMPSGSSGSGSSGSSSPCTVPMLAATGTDAAWPLTLGLLALATGASMMRFAHRSDRRTGR